MTERTVLARGCFWGMQDLIRKLPGVISTRVGYSDGDVPNATCRNHGTHAEKNAEGPFCTTYIGPKLALIRQKYGGFLRAACDPSSGRSAL